jgi:hypothetical protein
MVKNLPAGRFFLKVNGYSAFVNKKMLFFLKNNATDCSEVNFKEIAARTAGRKDKISVRKDYRIRVDRCYQKTPQLRSI